MQRRETEGRRQGAERDAAQPMTGQPRSGDDEDHLEEPERVPSFLSARELQAKDPAKGEAPVDEDAGERHASASFEGEDGEPTISGEEPPRSDRGMPEDRTERIQRRGPRHK